VVRVRVRLVLGGRGSALRGAPEDTSGRASTSCSRAQIVQFWTSRLCLQN
jgi:hypothetical protein